MAVGRVDRPPGWGGSKLDVGLVLSSLAMRCRHHSLAPQRSCCLLPADWPHTHPSAGCSVLVATDLPDGDDEGQDPQHAAARAGWGWVGVSLGKQAGDGNKAICRVVRPKGAVRWGSKRINQQSNAVAHGGMAGNCTAITQNCHSQGDPAKGAAGVQAHEPEGKPQAHRMAEHDRLHPKLTR